MGEPQAAAEEVPMQLQIAGRTEMIIYRISQHLPLSALKAIRQVNAQWEFGTRDAFFRSSKVRFNGTDAVNRYTLEAVPFIHSSFDMTFQVNMNHPPHTTAIMHFFDRFHQQVLQLTFTSVWRSSQDVFATFQCMPRLTVLRELRMTVYIASTHGHAWEMAPVTVDTHWPPSPSVRKLSMVWVFENNAEFAWTQGEQYNFAPLAVAIIAMFSNLEEFVLDDGLCTSRILTSTFQQTFFQALQANPGSLPNLREIRLSCNNVTPGYILQAPRLRLRSLSLFFNTPWDEVCSQNMYRILEQHATSLENLRLIIQPTKVNANQKNYVLGLRFPREMSELKDLKLLFNKPEKPFGRMQFPIGPIDYDSMFPKIRSLTVNIMGRSCEGLERFKDRIYQKFIPKAQFARICNNITDLKMQIPGPVTISMAERRNMEDLNLRIAQVFPNAWSQVQNEFSKGDWRMVPTTEEAGAQCWNTGPCERNFFWRAV